MRLFLLVGAATFGAFLFGRYATAPRLTATQSIQTDFDVKESLLLAVEYLVRATHADGQLDYCVMLGAPFECKDRYNVVRHAGTTFALATYCQECPSPSRLRAVRRQAEFLKTRCVAPAFQGSEMLAVWSDPVLTGQQEPRLAKLGGAALGLVALLSVEDILPGTTDEPTLRGLGRFIVFMQRPDGSFYSRFADHLGGRSDEKESLYYPGEAALGLIMLYEHESSPRWLEAAAMGLANLAEVRRNRESVEADHWALLATARLMPFIDQVECIVAKKAIVEHAAKICKSILRDRPPHAVGSPLRGCFSERGRTCPTATRLEGLQAALTFIGDPQLRDEIPQVVGEGVDFLIRAQIKEGKYRGAFPRSAPLAQNSSPYDGLATKIRVDYVQHALSALLQFAVATDELHSTRDAANQ